MKTEQIERLMADPNNINPEMARAKEIIRDLDARYKQKESEWLMNMVEIQNSFEMTQNTCQNLTEASIRLRDENKKLKSDFTVYMHATNELNKILEDANLKFAPKKMKSLEFIRGKMGSI